MGRGAYYILSRETPHKPDKPDIPPGGSEPDRNPTNATPCPPLQAGRASGPRPLPGCKPARNPPNPPNPPDPPRGAPLVEGSRRARRAQYRASPIRVGDRPIADGDRRSQSLPCVQGLRRAMARGHPRALGCRQEWSPLRPTQRARHARSADPGGVPQDRRSGTPLHGLRPEAGAVGCQRIQACSAGGHRLQHDADVAGSRRGRTGRRPDQPRLRRSASVTGTCGKYYAYIFRRASSMEEVDNFFSRGIVKDRNRLYWEDFNQIPSVFPPPEEQFAIARFLDHVDRHSRALHRTKRKLIALLNEQKHAIIHRAVTRGLDPNVSFKPSGAARSTGECGDLKGTAHADGR